MNELHDRFVDAIKSTDDEPAPLPDGGKYRAEGEAEGDQRQNFRVGGGSDQVRREQAEKHVRDPDLLASAHVFRNLGGAGDVHADSRVDRLHHDQTDHEREGSRERVVAQRIARDTSESADVAEARNAADDGGHDQRHDHHPQGDKKQIPEDLDGFTYLRPEPAHEAAEHCTAGDADQQQNLSPRSAGRMFAHRGDHTMVVVCPFRCFERVCWDWALIRVRSSESVTFDVPHGGPSADEGWPTLSACGLPP